MVRILRRNLSNFRRYRLAEVVWRAYQRDDGSSGVSSDYSVRRYGVGITAGGNRFAGGHHLFQFFEILI